MTGRAPVNAHGKNFFFRTELGTALECERERISVRRCVASQTFEQGTGKLHPLSLTEIVQVDRFCQMDSGLCQMMT